MSFWRMVKTKSFLASQKRATLIAIKHQFVQFKNAIHPQVAEFNEYTVQYGIDSATFEIKWYSDLMSYLKRR